MIAFKGLYNQIVIILKETFKHQWSKYVNIVENNLTLKTIGAFGTSVRHAPIEPVAVAMWVVPWTHGSVSDGGLKSLNATCTDSVQEILKQISV